LYTPSHSNEVNASARSSRRFWCSYHGRNHHHHLGAVASCLGSRGIEPVVASSGFIGSRPAGIGSISATWHRRVGATRVRRTLTFPPALMCHTPLSSRATSEALSTASYSRWTVNP